MARLKRIVYIVLFNILISAATTLTVLYFWGRSRPEEGTQVTVVVLANPTSPASQTSDLSGLASAYTEIPSPAIEATTPIASEPIELIEYQVKTGDTLSKIAVNFNASLQDIMTVNGITDPDLISVGETLYIPDAPLPTRTPLPPTTAAPTVTPRPGTATLTPSPLPAFTGEPPKPIIESIIGAGTLDSERIRITCSGKGELSLAGWRLEDADGNVYVFPNLNLYEGGMVILHTTQGLDTVTNLYWNLTQPVWQPGETAILRDARGTERARYRLP